MDLNISTRLKHAWNAFTGNRDPTPTNYGYSYSRKPDRPRLSAKNEKSIVNALYNRIAIDVAAISIQHVQLDKDGRYISTVNSGLNNCLTLEANIDQTGRSFIQDIVMSMLDEGCVAIVPVETTINPKLTDSYDITSMRTGRIVEWYPKHVKVEVYNENLGKKEELVLPKKVVAIVENPLYAIVNEPNSTLQRLIRKLNLLDAIDEQSGSGKLDMIIQVPYTVRSEPQRERAEQRRKDIESQLSNTKYGIAYADATERITQLNRPVENNLMKQIEYLTSMVYSQIGITQSVLDGTADEKTMLNYNTRSIEPILSAIVDAMKRTFLTKTARTQGKSIMAFRDHFKLVPAGEIAEIADKFTRNEILSKNEVRQILGMKPSKDPKADQLINSNISQSANAPTPSQEVSEENYEEGDNQNGVESH